MRVLVLNPGSTSTKLAWFEDRISKAATELRHDAGTVAAPILEQRAPRGAAMRAFVEETGGGDFDAVIALGGLLRPGPGGTYRVDAAMLSALESSEFGEHASALGAMLAQRYVEAHGGVALVADPISTDELASIARFSGVPEIQRWGRSHASSLKAVARRVAAALDRPLGSLRVVGVHMGGGISVAALRGDRIVDVNDAMLGMGPFSGRRAGALPIRGVLDLAFAPDADRKQIEYKLTMESGLQGYLQTADVPEIERRIAAGDARAEAVYNAMIYQIAKEVGAMAATLSFDLHAIALTGGMAVSDQLVERLTGYISRLGRVLCYPGELEMQALAERAFRVLQGQERVATYGARP